MDKRSERMKAEGQHHYQVMVVIPQSAHAKEDDAYTKALESAARRLGVPVERLAEVVQYDGDVYLADEECGGQCWLNEED